MVVSTLVKVLANILLLTPPPTKYLKVNVVLVGVVPYVSVKIKLVGLYAVVNLSCPNGNPKPTLNGFGITFSVTVAGDAAPNCSCNRFLSKYLVANLF